MYQYGKKIGLGNEFLVAAVIAVLALFPAYLAANFANERARENHQLEFDLYTQVRVANLRNELDTRAKALDTVATVIPELDANDQEKFQRVVSPLIDSLVLRSICWHDLVNNISYRVPSDALDCDQFELFKSAKFYDYAEPKLMLSRAAGDRDSISRGFVSVVMDGASLLSSNHNNGIEETMLFNDKTQQSLNRFSYRQGMLQFKPATEFQAQSSSIYQSLLSLSGVEIFYYAILAPLDGSNFFLVLAFVWMLLVVACFFVYSLLWRKHLLHAEVADRTEELTQFAYRTSHDLKSPLSSIKQLMGFVAIDVKEGYQARALEDIERARSQAEKLENLVTEILDLAHADHQFGGLQSWSFNEQLEAFRELHFQLIQKSAVEIEQRAEDIEVLCDRVRVSQILDNLLTNSIKYAKEEPVGRMIKVTFKALRNWSELTVEDNGVGLPDEFFTNQVENFKRYRPDLAEGSGLGLSIVRRHADKMGAKLTFSSLGQGTKVVLRFPSKVIADNKPMAA